MAVAPIEPHALHSERLIFHAELEIVQGDRLQASDYGLEGGRFAPKMVRSPQLCSRASPSS